MNNKPDTRKQSRILYSVIVAVLVIMASLIAVTSVLNRNTGNPVDSDTDSAQTTIENRVPTNTEPITADEQTEPVDADETDATDVIADGDSLPTFAAPTDGYLINEHSVSVPVFSVTMNDYRTHSGVDISVDEGDKILAAADGVIGSIWEDPLMGYCLTIVHSGGAVSTYKNLYNEFPEGIAAGAEVEKGQTIAAAGSSALIEIAEEPHVHYELSIDGKTVDPADYITFKVQTDDYED